MKKYNLRLFEKNIVKENGCFKILYHQLKINWYKIYTSIRIIL